MEWIIENKEWLFSGIISTLFVALIGWLFFSRRKQGSQTQKSGKNSTNIQAGGDINVGGSIYIGQSKTEKRR